MSLLTKIKERFRHDSVTLELNDIQALILRSRPEPYVGMHIMLHIEEKTGGQELLRRLSPHITSAKDWTEDLDYWIGVGISYQGMKALGVPEATLKSFPLAFQQGMAARAAQLRDQGPNAPENWEEPFKPGNCHIALTIYARDKQSLDSAVAVARAELERSSGVIQIGSHEFGAPEGVKNPFGFRDNIANPTVEGSGLAPQAGEERAIKAGEFILGYPSENGQNLGMPEPAALGKNGSFVVFRKYVSRVGAFNAFLKEHAATPEEQEMLAAKLFGRWRSGAPLLLAPDADDPELGNDPERNNDFTYRDDPKGNLAPLGCHMRRMNPRDSELTILTDVNIHRIIRRSSTFGPVHSSEITPDEDTKRDRGIFFIFISARAFDTIEFLQQEWVNRGNFIDLGEERDPIAGLHEENSQFTIPRHPVRQRISGIETFNIMAGGEYLFLPGLSALRWLAEQTTDD